MSPTPEELAQRFHETYERLAPEHGYETRRESAKPWSEVPEQNKKLMVAVCSEMLNLHLSECDMSDAREEALLRDFFWIDENGGKNLATLTVSLRTLGDILLREQAVIAAEDVGPLLRCIVGRCFTGGSSTYAIEDADDVIRRLEEDYPREEE